MPLQPVPGDLVLPESSSALSINWLEESDLADLALEFSLEDFQYFPNKPASETVEAWMAHTEGCTRQGVWLMVIRDAGTNELLCLTSFLDWKPAHRGVEIGHTLVVPKHRGTWVNPTIKLELMRHCFEVLSLNRVQLKAHALNLRSRKAIQKIGAQYEGTLRQNTLMSDGSWRDTAYYSVLSVEWPEVKGRLGDVSAYRP